MKTWEMIKKLTENPKLKFVRVSDNVRFITSTKMEEVKVTDYYISAIHSPSHECIRLNDDWELVREPVDFIVAAAHLQKGGKAKVEWDNTARTYVGWGLRDNKNQPLSIDEIINGKWYIED